MPSAYRFPNLLGRAGNSLMPVSRLDWVSPALPQLEEKSFRLSHNATVPHRKKQRGSVLSLLALAAHRKTTARSAAVDRRRSPCIAMTVTENDNAELDVGQRIC